jgi:hypothetical protein
VFSLFFDYLLSMSINKILEQIASSFIASAKLGNFNGIIASNLLRIEANPENLRNAIHELISDRKITAIFACTSENMHIKRLPDLPISKQIEFLSIEELSECCLYPNKVEVQRRVEIGTWQERPFSKALLLTEPQLAFRAFDMGALERYVADPRYSLKFNDYMGWMSISDDSFRNEEHLERDKVSLQSFGLGFDSKRNPYTIIYLRYLANLSAEHQQYWLSYQASGDIRMSEPYYRSSIEGKFWKNRSILYAITEEMRTICLLTKAIWGQSLFRELDNKNLPIGLTSFLRPTSENFNRFVMALDKLLSENIDRSFFDGKCSMEVEKTRPDGKVEVIRIGTLRLLEEWLRKEIIWENLDEFTAVIIKPLKEVRRLRQKPAHAFTTDNFSVEYYNKRRRLLWNILNSLSNIRATFAKHQLAQDVKVPDWIDNEKIDVI